MLPNVVCITTCTVVGAVAAGATGVDATEPSCAVAVAIHSANGNSRINE
jgi:hypothetical protein